MSAVLSASQKPAVALDEIRTAETKKDVAGAIERLALSRELLRSAMRPAATKKAGQGLGAGVGAAALSLVERVKTLPGAAVFLEAVTEWWSHHPLRTAGLVAAEASRKLAAPVAQRNPIGLVVCAVVVGALLALSRPWRWMLRPALLAGLLPALASRAIRELPVDAWLKVLASFTTPSTPAPAARKPVSRQPTPEYEGSPYP